jgi:hypothetical protein
MASVLPYNASVARGEPSDVRPKEKLEVHTFGLAVLSYLSVQSIIKQVSKCRA